MAALVLLSACGDDGGQDTADEDPVTTTTSQPDNVTDRTPDDEASDETPATWTEVAVEGAAPPPRTSAVLVAAADGTLWLHGGRVDGQVVGDLWHFDGNGWDQAEAAGPAPDPRDEHVGVWDDDRDRLIVAMGQTTTQEVFDDVWAFDPGAGEWELLSQGGPSARYGSCAVLDDQGRLLLSHGFSTQQRFADTWAFDLAQESWTDITPPEGDSPVARCLHACGWDPHAGEMVLFGGRTDAARFVGDTWRLGSSGWQEVSGEGPSARVHAGGIHTDAGFHLLGGEGDDGITDDAWRLADGGWGPGPEEAPTSRHSHAVTYGESVAWLFGGAAEGGDLDDLWRYG